MTEPPAPTPLRVASGVLLVQGVGLVVAGVVELVEALAGHPNDRGTAVFLGGLVVFYGLAVLAVGRGLAGQRTWAGTPAYLVEFFAVVVGAYNLHTLPAVAAVLLASAAVAVWGLVHPLSREVLVRRR